MTDLEKQIIKLIENQAKIFKRLKRLEDRLNLTASPEDKDFWNRVEGRPDENI